MDNMILLQVKNKLFRYAFLHYFRYVGRQRDIITVCCLKRNYYIYYKDGNLSQKVVMDLKHLKAGYYRNGFYYCNIVCVFILGENIFLVQLYSFTVIIVRDPNIISS